MEWKKGGIYQSPTIKGILNKVQIERSVIGNEWFGILCSGVS